MLLPPALLAGRRAACGAHTCAYVDVNESQRAISRLSVPKPTSPHTSLCRGEISGPKPQQGRPLAAGARGRGRGGIPGSERPSVYVESAPQKVAVCIFIFISLRGAVHITLYALSAATLRAGGLAKPWSAGSSWGQRAQKYPVVIVKRDKGTAG